MTAYVLNFWIEANRKGFTVPEFALQRGIQALSAFVQQTSPAPTQLGDFAYALYVLAQVQQVDIAQVRYFFETYLPQMPSALGAAQVGAALALLGDLPRAEKAFDQAFLLLSPEKEIKEKKENHDLIKSPLRDGAAIIALAFEIKEKVPTLPFSQEKIFSAVQTLSEIIQARFADAEKIRPDNALSLQEQSWLLIAGQFLQGEAASLPVSLQVNQDPISQNSHGEWELKVSPDTLPNKEGLLTLKNTGKEPVWLLTTLMGTPLKITPASKGLTLTRRFYTLEGKEISVDKIAQNTQVVIVLSGEVLSNRLHQLLFVDLLPAGFEIENARIHEGNATSDLSWLKTLSVADQTELKDDRYTAMLRLSPEVRTFKLAYIVRAITCGMFAYPAAFVEDVYAPTFFSRTSEEKLTVTP